MSMSRRIVVALLVVVALAVGVPAWAHSHHKHHHHGHHHHSHHGGHESGHDSDSGGNDGGSDIADDNGGDLAVPSTGVATTGPERLETFRITGFGKKDNTPRNSTKISMPVIHQQAGGTGTFTDPLTAATPGHSGNTESRRGEKFYVPSIHRYVIVEDSGASKFSQPHLDIWSGTTSNVEECEGRITMKEQIIVNPGPRHPVKAGPLATGSGCNI